MSLKDGGPAFPVPADTLRDHTSGTTVLLAGMSLRDYFAAHAPAPHDWYILESLPHLNSIRSLNESVTVRKAAEIAWPYVWADLQLAERAK